MLIKAKKIWSRSVEQVLRKLARYGNLCDFFTQIQNKQMFLQSYFIKHHKIVNNLATFNALLTCS